MQGDTMEGVYVNRELSWLSFNERVLEEAENKEVPLYERLKFVSIFANNLDEFYMVRVGSIFDQTLLKTPVFDSKTGMSSKEQLDCIFEGTKVLLPRKDKAYHDIMAELAPQNIRQVDFNNLSKEEHAYFQTYFKNEVLPLLSPQIIDKQHPFPFFENKKLFVLVSLTTKNGNGKLGIVPVERYLERIVYMKDKDNLSFALMEEIILYFVGHIFGTAKMIEKSIFRVTRNADIDVDDNMVDTDLDYRETMEELLKKRRKLMPIRLELSHAIQPHVLAHICEMLTLSTYQVFICSSPLDMSFVFALEGKVKNETLFFPPLRPQKHGTLREDLPMAEQVLKKDVLLHYPYHDMKPLMRLLEEAAEDRQVVSIKMTLYRVANDSKIVNALIKAAENGKDVSVVVELKARFDEKNNIDWSKRLEEAGCNVVYGLDGYKVHSKLMLIVRKNGPSIQYISHIGTGNFNEKTAKTYTDISLLTANKEIGSEVSSTFNSLFLGQTVESTQYLLVAPHSFKNKIIGYIDREIAIAKSGETAEITLKINSLTDKMIINKLMEASQSGVQVHMVVRGICCIRAGLKGKTENIHVISIVGRFLEHSRIYVFGVGERRRIYISSADFMTRNTERRVEVATPIYDKENQVIILHILKKMFEDNVKARRLTSGGTFVMQHNEGAKLDSQLYFYKEAYEKSVSPAPQKVTNFDKNEGNFASFVKRLFKKE